MYYNSKEEHQNIILGKNNIVFRQKILLISESEYRKYYLKADKHLSLHQYRYGYVETKSVIDNYGK